MSEPAFDPSRHLTQLRGRGGTSDYLEVKWRLVWLRDKHPDASITTELIELTDQRAVFKATVTVWDDGSVAGTATGHGSETTKDFGDYIEKAETKAIGRALAALGFGTQFAPELEEGERIVDSPVSRDARAYAPPTPLQPKPRAARQDAPHAPQTHDEEQSPIEAEFSAPGPSQRDVGAFGKPALRGSDRQVQYAKALAKERGYELPDGHTDLDRLMADYPGKSASDIIDMWTWKEAMAQAGEVANGWRRLPQSPTIQLMKDRHDWYETRLHGSLTGQELDAIWRLCKIDKMADDELTAVYRQAKARLTGQQPLAAE